MKLATRIFRRTNYYITSPFGKRKAIYNAAGKLISKAGMHNGCDYGTKGVLWPQYALEDGVILSAGKDSTGAIFAWVRYPRLKIELLHYHLSSLCVKKGTTVVKNMIIGYTGKTGNATGVHLHLGLRKTGSTKYYDPETYEYNDYVKPPTIIKVYYVVKLGDTLATIAKAHKMTWRNLYKKNKKLIDECAKDRGVKSKFYNHIYPGQKLIIKETKVKEG